MGGSPSLSHIPFAAFHSPAAPQGLWDVNPRLEPEIPSVSPCQGGMGKDGEGGDSVVGGL